MTDENLKLMMESIGASLFADHENPAATIAILISETVKFRDKLKEDTGQVLTVEDTRTALDALELGLAGEKLPNELTSEQRTLTQIWIDRLTVFREK